MKPMARTERSEDRKLPVKPIARPDLYEEKKGNKMLDYKYLVCVDGNGNHNKFYEATLNDDASIDVNYGRVGQSGTKHHYTPYEKNFDTLIRSKERKGYQDITATKEIQTASQDADSKKNADFLPMEDKKAENFLKNFLEVCRTKVQKNYKNPNIVTQKQIDSALKEVEQLEKIVQRVAGQDNANISPATIRNFNETLTTIFAVVPRKMSHVSAYLLPENIKDKDTFIEKANKIIDKEADLLDSLAIVTQKTAVSVTQDKMPDKTIAENLGVSIQRASYQDEDKVKELMDRSKVDDRSSDRREAMVYMYAITNGTTEKAYQDFKAKNDIKDDECKLLFHGSGQENWYTIMETGLKLRPNAVITGKGLGNGIYFADDINKALNYTRTSGTRYVGVYEVAVGKPYDTQGRYDTSLSLSRIGNQYDSVFLDGKKCGGHHLNEYCIYREEQANLKYIIACEKEDRLNVRFSMHLSIPFQNLAFEGEKMTAEAELSDYARKQLQKVSITPLGDKVTASYDGCVFTLEDENGTFSLTDDEATRLTRDFKKSFFESEYDYETFMDKKDKMTEEELVEEADKRNGLDDLEEDMER